MEDVFGTFAEGPDVPGDTAPAHIRRALRSAGLHRGGDRHWLAAVV